MIEQTKSHRSAFTRAVPLALLLASASLYAQQPMGVHLTGASEVPPVTTSAMGMVHITVLPDHTVSGNIKLSGMVPTMAHIHEAAAGKNGPVIVTLTKSDNNSFTVPGDAKLTDAQYTSYKAGNLYVNVHSAQSPGGEIRAQLPAAETAGKPMSMAY